MLHSFRKNKETLKKKKIKKFKKNLKKKLKGVPFHCQQCVDQKYF